MTWASKLVSKSAQTAREIDYSVFAAEAAQMYDEACTPQGPPWKILGEATQGVWLRRAYLKSQGITDWWSIKHIQ